MVRFFCLVSYLFLHLAVCYCSNCLEFLHLFVCFPYVVQLIIQNIHISMALSSHIIACSLFMLLHLIAMLIICNIWLFSCLISVLVSSELIYFHVERIFEHSYSIFLFLFQVCHNLILHVKEMRNLFSHHLLFTFIFMLYGTSNSFYTHIF